MADKDNSWWQDDATDSNDDDATWGTRTTQNDASSFDPRCVNEGFDPRLETFEKKNIKKNNP